MIAHSRFLEPLERSPALRGITRPRLTPYIPNRPTKKQRTAMCLPHVRELFYGGAAGGGKSDWLLMEALQYVDCRDYRAKIFRLTLSDADNEDSIMFRANEWLTGTDAKKEKNGTRWRFPSGATLSFGGMDKRDDHLKQQGAQFSFLGFDELTQFKSHQFEYVINSRLRKPGCGVHTDVRDPECPYCKRYMHTNAFPLRIRCAANPGGRSHSYVKNRYDIGAIPGLKGPTGEQLYAGRFNRPRMGADGEMIAPRPHIPAFAHDNPFLDVADYTRQLKQMTDPVTRRQLLAGDWGVTADGRFKRKWIRRWQHQPGGHLFTSQAFHRDQSYEFLMVDTASSTKDTPGKAELTTKQASWTVVSRWMVLPNQDLLLIHVDRFQEELPDILEGIKRGMRYNQRPVRFVGMELTVQSKHCYQACQRAGLPMRSFTTGGKDKVARSMDAANRMKDGKIYLPLEGEAWLADFEDEVFTWTGDKDETDDQVDVLAYAGIYMTEESLSSTAELPGIY